MEDHQAELRGVSARIDQLSNDLNRLGLTRGPCKLYRFYMPHIANIHSRLLTLVLPPGPGVEPGGFIVPGGPGPGAPGVRPGTVPPGGAFVPPPPQVSFPQPGQQYTQQYPIGVIPPVVSRPYRTPTPSESPVYPSPPSRDGGAPFIPPDLGRAGGASQYPLKYTNLRFLGVTMKYTYLWNRLIYPAVPGRGLQDHRR